MSPEINQAWSFCLGGDAWVLQYVSVAEVAVVFGAGEPLGVGMDTNDDHHLREVMPFWIYHCSLSGQTVVRDCVHPQDFAISLRMIELRVKGLCVIALLPMKWRSTECSSHEHRDATRNAEQRCKVRPFTIAANWGRGLWVGARCVGEAAGQGCGL